MEEVEVDERVLLEEVILELVVVEGAFDVEVGVEVELEVFVVATTGGVEVVGWTEEEVSGCLDDAGGDAGGDAEDDNVGVGEVDETNQILT